MLPAELPPSKQKVERNRRLLDWVKKSNCGLLPEVEEIRPSIKAKHAKRNNWPDENLNEKGPVLKKIKRDKTSKPMSPSKFYVPNVEEKHAVVTKEFLLPSTPESKKSGTPSSTSSCLLSPDKLDGIFIRRRSAVVSSNNIQSDSESVTSTPVKQKMETRIVHRLPCGLDSPASETTLDSSEKKFSKLGHRLTSKTPLQLFKESIRSSTKKINFGKHSHNTAPPNKRIRERAACKDLLAAAAGSTAESALESTLEPGSELETSRLTALVSEGPTPKRWNTMSNFTDNTRTAHVDNREVGLSNESKEDLDRTDSTLDSGPNLVQKKLLPLFQRNIAMAKDKDKKDQLVIDAGQKSLDDARQCTTCRMIYTRGDPHDETLHRQFHSRLLQALKFTGWKRENVAERGDDHRVLYIDYNDPPHCHKKVQSLKVILDQELGYVQESEILKPNRRIYLYVSDDKLIKGVCIAESITKANRLEGDRASVAAVRARVGINRLWVYAKYRREGVATSLLDSVRSTFEMGMCLPRQSLAFSDPTSHGRMFAAKYTGSECFLVYKP